jgi:hypothetical protein
MRIREDSGDTETDIGFDSNGDLDTAAIASHCGSANGYVVTWYDQSGNSRDVTQSTTTNQPQIYNGTATLADNGKPAMLFAVDFLQATFTLSHIVTFFGVAQPQFVTGVGDKWLVDGVSNFHANAVKVTSTSSIQVQNVSAYIAASYTNNSQQLFSFLNNQPSTSELRVNGSGTTGTLNTRAMGGVTIGCAPGYVSTTAWPGYVQELVWYASDKSSDFGGIESNINTYFSIYP